MGGCSVMCMDTDGERKYLPQFIKFSSMNSLGTPGTRPKQIGQKRS